MWLKNSTAWGNMRNVFEAHLFSFWFIFELAIALDVSLLLPCLRTVFWSQHQNCACKFILDLCSIYDIIAMYGHMEMFQQQILKECKIVKIALPESWQIVLMMLVTFEFALASILQCLLYLTARFGFFTRNFHDPFRSCKCFPWSILASTCNFCIPCLYPPPPVVTNLWHTLWHFMTNCYDYII